MNATSLETNSAIRQSLEAVARQLEAKAGNEVYQRAWKIAVQIIRSHKPD